MSKRVTGGKSEYAANLRPTGKRRAAKQERKAAKKEAVPPLHIMWGESPEEGTKASTYTFDTAAERAAFIRGVEEMDGWAGWEEVDGPDIIVCGECDEMHVPGECAKDEEDEE
jgi:hypothetical protein